MIPHRAAQAQLFDVFRELTDGPGELLYQCSRCGLISEDDDCECCGCDLDEDGNFITTGWDDDAPLICPACGGDAFARTWDELTAYEI